MNQKKIFFFSFLIIVLLFVSATFCFAQKELELNYPSIHDIKIEITTVSLGEYIKYIFYFAIAISGLLAFGALIYGGVRYLASAGNPAAVTDAKDQIFAGILGLVILLSSYLILNTIDPQLVTLKTPEITLLATTTLPSLEEGSLCFYDKNCGDGNRKLLNCLNGAYPQKPAEGDIESVVASGTMAVAFFELPYYGGKRICLKDSSALCDLTKYSFSGNLFDSINDDINSVNILPPEKCELPGEILPAGSKDNFSAAVIAYKNKNFGSPAVLTFFGEGEGRSTEPPDVIKSIKIKDGSLAIRLFSETNYGATGGRTICFKNNVQDLTQYAYSGWWKFKIGWDIRIRSIKIINNSDCNNEGSTEEVEK